MSSLITTCCRQCWHVGQSQNTAEIKRRQTSVKAYSCKMKLRNRLTISGAPEISSHAASRYTRSSGHRAQRVNSKHKHDWLLGNRFVSAKPGRPDFKLRSSTTEEIVASSADASTEGDGEKSQRATSVHRRLQSVINTYTCIMTLFDCLHNILSDWELTSSSSG